MTMGKESFFLAIFLQSASYFRSRRGKTEGEAWFLKIHAGILPVFRREMKAWL